MTLTRYGHTFLKTCESCRCPKHSGRHIGYHRELQEFSEMGPPLSSITEIKSDYRFLVCGNYLAFYRVKGIEVSIDRILYGRRDYLRILFGNPSEEATK